MHDMNLVSDPPPGITGNPRYDKLIALIGARGYMRIDELASLLGVSTQTIRRDIRRLSDDGFLSRYHGGAAQASSAINTALEKREVAQIDEKRAIAEAVVARIPDRSTVFLSSGTTIEYLAKALDPRNDLRIITTSLRVANLLYRRRDFDVMLPGGTLRPQNSGIVGPAAEEFLRGFRADFLVLSLGALDPDGTMLEFDINEVAVMRIMMANAKQVYVAADHTKFHASASVKLANTSEIDALFTDEAPPAALAAVLEQQQVEVVVVSIDPAMRTRAPGIESSAESGRQPVESRSA
jgi:DeoR/GlpR family transcriptional regulator of sugar metabolism